MSRRSLDSMTGSLQLVRVQVMTALTVVLSMTFANLNYGVFAQSPDLNVDLKATHDRFVERALDVKSFADLESLAKLQSSELHLPRASLTGKLANLTYEEFRDIRFQPEKAIWKDASPFYFETFHRGYVQRDRVDVFLIDSDAVRELPFNTNLFEYGDSNDAIKLDADANPGHAGLKLVCDVPGVVDAEEMLTFLGASYFRGRSKVTEYGTSARALAINVAMNQDEEFPYFQSFWICRPDPADTTLTVLGLLESQSVVGAYEFQFEPGGVESELAVKATLYFRTSPEKVAYAPLTSMWMWGDGLEGPPLDQRPGVHDADGLLVRTIESDESEHWVWRPLGRQEYPSVSRIDVHSLQGFGLMQRNRAFYHYDDHNAKYHLRPSVWIEPSTPWHSGHIELLEIPGAHEGIDNIAAFWVTDQPISTDSPIQLDYKVHFFPGDHKHEDFVGRATNLQVDRDPTTPDQATLTVRFSGPGVATMCDPDSIEADIKLIRGELVEHRLTRTQTGDWIAKLTIRFLEKAPVEVALQLKDVDRVLSEDFRYLLPPRKPEFTFPAVYTRKES